MYSPTCKYSKLLVPDQKDVAAFPPRNAGDLATAQRAYKRTRQGGLDIYGPTWGFIAASMMDQTMTSGMKKGLSMMHTVNVSAVLS